MLLLIVDPRMYNHDVTYELRTYDSTYRRYLRIRYDVRTEKIVSKMKNRRLIITPITPLSISQCTSHTRTQQAMRWLLKKKLLEA